MDSDKFQSSLLIAMSLLLMLLIAIRYAQPIEDGDLFWNMAYGKYLIDHRTLIPDHTVYSWTPADNSVIKNEWLTEIALFLIHKVGGLNALFATSYLFVILTLFLLLNFIQKIGQKLNPLHLIMITICLFSSKSGIKIKPEMFSAIYFCILTYLLLVPKIDGLDKNNAKYIYLIPLLMLVWVNSHGVVLFGFMLYCLFLCGELLNYFLPGRHHTHIDYIKRHLVSFSLCLFAFIINPYGFNFPKKLINLIFFTDRNDYLYVAAYNSILKKGFEGYYYFEYWLLMSATLLFLIIFCGLKRHRIDYAIILPNLVFAALFIKYIRSTYYWSAYWAFSVVYLADVAKIKLSILNSFTRRIISSACLILLILFSMRIADERFFSTKIGSWTGFGIGYLNPVEESRFVKKYFPKSRLYNSYSDGGYLLWDLYPTNKVFIDPRYFPYRGWINEYQEFNYSDRSLESFSAKYPFDVAILDYITSKVSIHKFNTSKDWRLAYYGTSAAVFVKKDIDFNHDSKQWNHSRFDQLKNLNQAESIFVCALNFGDYETSKYLLELIKRKFKNKHHQSDCVIRCELALRGVEAFENKNYQAAINYLETHGRQMFAYRVNRYLKQLRDDLFKQSVENKQYKMGLMILKRILKDTPDEPIVLFNMGILTYLVEDNPNAPSGQWRNYLNKAVAMLPEDKKENRLSTIATKILTGKVLPSPGVLIMDQSLD